MSASSSSVSVWYSFWLKQPPAWQLGVQTELFFKSRCTCKLLYTHKWPFQPETKVLEVKCTWLVANFVTTHSLPSSESSRAGNSKFRTSLLFKSWAFLERTPNTSMFPGFKHWLAWPIGEMDPSSKWTKVSKILSFSSNDKREFIQVFMKTPTNLHLSFQLRESTLSWHWDNRTTQSPWAEFGHLCLSGDLGAVSIRKTVLPGMAIPMLKIRRPNGRLIFNMEIAIRR